MALRIMYVCEDCADGNPEGCGHYDREEIRLAPNGKWLCESCYDDSREEEAPTWAVLPVAPEYAPVAELRAESGR